MRSMCRITVRSSALLAMLIYTQSADAQLWGGTPGEFGGFIPDPPATAWLPCADGSCDDEDPVDDGGAAGIVVPAEPAARSSDAPAADGLTFVSSAERRAQNLTKFVARTRARSPAQAAPLQQMLSSPDIIGQIGEAVAPLGLLANNVADAYALYWISAWNGANGIETPPDHVQIQAVRRQAAAALSARPDITGADNAFKQEMAEGLLLQSLLIDQTIAGAKADPATLAQVATAIRQGASATGLELDRMDLTANGFVSR